MRQQTSATQEFIIEFPEAERDQWAKLADFILYRKPSIYKAIETTLCIKFDRPRRPKNHKKILSMPTCFRIYGTSDQAPECTRILSHLLSQLGQIEYYDRQKTLKMCQKLKEASLTTSFTTAVNIPTQKGLVRNTGFVAQNDNQALLYDMIETKKIVFAVGPAGTGKTHIAVKRAVEAWRTSKKIILCRPAVDADEELGHLPGSAEDKVAPYMRPFYDELDEMIGRFRLKKSMEEGKIEIAPVAFMRGRTLKNAFIVIDEAQNLTFKQLKMLLTRVGNNSTMVIAGDPTQDDLPHRKKSGLASVVRQLHSTEGIGIVQFTERDCVRDPIVEAILSSLTEDSEPDASQPAALRGGSAPRPR